MKHMQPKTRVQLAVAAVRGAFTGAVGAAVTWLIDHLSQR